MAGLKFEAQKLSAYFQAEGYFADAPEQLFARVAPATARTQPNIEITGFHGLSVRAVGYAEKTEAGDGLFGFHIYLNRGSKRQIDSLPDAVNGVPLHAHKIGPVHVKPRQSSLTTNRGRLFEYNNRIACGSSCAPAKANYSGTIGALLRKGSSLFALSNNHVFGDCNHTPVGQPIMCPSNADSGPNTRSMQEIGRHHQIVELRSGIPDLVPKSQDDTAIARITAPSDVTSWQGDDQIGYDTPAEVIEPEPGMRVKKIGRTTALTFGEVESEQVDFTLPYESENFKAVVWFENVWAISRVGRQSFALPGDSGSLVVTEDGKFAVGLLFAATSKGEYGFIVPISHVLTALGGVQLVSGYGV